MAELYGDNKPAQIGIAVALSMLVMTDFIGNILVILVILTNRSMKTPINYLLINLAIADIMVGLFMAPRFIFSQFFNHPDGIGGKVMCSLLTGANIAWLALVASSASLVAISLERYFAIVRPLSTKYRLTKTKVKRTSTLCWVFGLVINLPLFFIRVYDKKDKLCVESWPKDKQWLAIAYSAVWFIAVGVVPIAVMVVVYSRVVYALWFKRSQQQGTQQALQKSRKRVTKMVVSVSVIYAACMLPNLTMYLLDYVTDQKEYDVQYIISIILYALNSSINPVVYTFQSQHFRQQMKKLVCCGKLPAGVDLEISNISLNKSRSYVVSSATSLETIAN
ncbi:tachykinin-like peptides receptor 86C [Actinia tenebrosa]|uniref:Tachykinin-like peptides receptor 86C n=1 Tax=Actinia tenebrosa TaxID=6105 RepID=A0A6P8J8G3_ACTTE|nr:tachykinin-like peptides receptor 86C [Actinia tenebrosa]